MDETIPVCYYKLNNIRVPVKGRFKKIAEHLYGFAVDRVIPAKAVLLIDPIPTRRWGTYYDATWFNTGGCATDNPGNVFITGGTQDLIHIATIGAFQATFGGVQDAFLVKFSTTGQRLWGTYYGGSDGDWGYSCAVDGSGNIFIVRSTSSAIGFGTPGAYQLFLRGSQDAFVAKFNSAGMRIWGTYYGGNEVYPPGGELFTYCATDTLGNVYCAGKTSSPDYISSPGAAQPNYAGGGDGFLVKFTGDGQRSWGTYYGGNSFEEYMACAVSKNGFVYLSGTTNSPNNIATPGSFMPTYNGQPKGFLAAFDTNGQRLWGTYYGGESGDITWGCAADTGSNVYIYGTTSSLTNISTPGSFQETQVGGIGNAYLTKFSSTCQRLWGTYYGSGNTRIYEAAIDSNGFIFFVGDTYSQNTIIASPGAYQTVFGGGYDDALLAKFNGNGYRIWGTYYGGTGADEGLSCAVDHLNNIYFCGLTSTANNTNNVGPCTRNPHSNVIATPDALYPELAYVNDGYLVKFSDCWSPDTALQINGPSSLCQNTTGTVFSIAPIPTATDYTWCVTGDLTITTGQGTTAITINVGPTLGLDTISVYGINACDTGFPKMITRRVDKRPVPVLSGSDTTCAGIDNPATSNAITMIVNSNLPAGVSITATPNPFCPGSSVTFNAIPSNGGSLPAYQWKVNGNNAGVNSDTYSYNPENGDSVRCIMTSNLSCVTGSPVSSAKIIMSGTLAPIVSFTSCFDTITTVNAKPIKLKGGIPLGGTYSGPGVNSLTGVFTPALAGVGTHTITYTYTNAALCSALSHTHIIHYQLSIAETRSPISGTTKFIQQSRSAPNAGCLQT